MNWRDIPSLSALRAFESTARHGGFSHAARELNVTHAAIAQHVRAIEADLGQSLVQRAGRGMALTEAGKILADALKSGFGEIAGGVEAVRTFGQTQPLKIALTPSFAENWLMPRIGGFWQQHPEIQLALVPGFDLVDLKRDRFDLAIRYGRGDWVGLDAIRFVSAAHVLVAAPNYAKTLAPDLANAQWLLEAGRSEPQLWAQMNGFDTASFTEFQTNSMILAAVRAGHGVTVQGRALVERDLDEGRLVSLHSGEDDELAYYLLQVRGHRDVRLKAFIDWLRANA